MIHLYYCLQNLSLKSKKQKQPFRKTNPKKMVIFKIFRKALTYLGLLSRTFTNHRTAGEGGGNFFNSSLPVPPASQTLRH